MAKSRRYWSRLPPELLSKIASTLDEITDRIRFGAVCKPWQSASKSKTVLSQPSLPWLLLPQPRTAATDIHKFFSLSENKIYPLPLPETHKTAIYESSHGYLLTQDHFGMDKTVHLLNPITRIHIPLPPLPPLPPMAYYNVQRWRLIVRPQSTILMLSVGFGPIYVIEKEQAGAGADWGMWRAIIDVPRSTRIEFTFHRGSFFVLDCRFGETTVMDPHSLKEVLSIPRAAIDGDDLPFSRYLVESSSGDELFMVIMYMRPPWFEIFRLDHGEHKWVEVRSIGEDVMFVDYRNALALSARDFSGCRGDCIYFVNFAARVNCPSLFDIESGRVEDVPHCWDNSVSRWKYHGWIIPTVGVETL